MAIMGAKLGKCGLFCYWFFRRIISGQLAVGSLQQAVSTIHFQIFKSSN